MMRHLARLVLGLASLFALLAGSLWAQAPAAPQAAAAAAPALKFDYFRVDPVPPGPDPQPCAFSSGAEHCVSSTMYAMVSNAYGVDPDQIFGGPAWMNHNLYTLRGHTAGTFTVEQTRQMFRTALTDYFGLKVHTEQRPMPALVLTVTKPTAKLKPAADPDAAPACKTPPAVAHGAAPPAPGTRRALVLDCTSVTMDDAVATLPRTIASTDLNHPLVNQTGLTGKFDFELRFLPRTGIRQPDQDGYDPEVDITILTAFQNLGLKLSLGEAPAPVLVVDAVNPDVFHDAAHPESAPIQTAFDVVNMKPVDNPTPQMRSSRVTPGGEVDLCCFPLTFFISNGYDLDPAMLADAPDWVGTELWSLQAKAAPGTTITDTFPMLQSMLKDTFKLSMHDEKRPMQVYVLQLASTDHPRLVRNTKGGADYCGVERDDDGVNFAEGCTNATMAEFAQKMHRNMMPSYFGDHPVVDMTGLTGTWDFKYKCATASLVGAIPAGVGPNFTPGPVNPTGQTCNEALKSLGLKITADKLPVTVKIIDHIEKPNQ